MIGIWEALGILVLIILAWWILGKGFKKEAPEMGKAVGETLKEFKRAVTEVEDIKKEVKKKPNKNKD